MTIAKVNFELQSDLLHVQRRDFPLADPTLATPSNAVALYDGEWVTLNSTGKIVRAAAVATPGDPALFRSFPVFMEKGRYDVQAMATRKTDLLWLGEWEADSRVFDAAVTIGSGAPITAMLQPVKVATVTIGARNYVGLVGHGGSADSQFVVGYVTKLPATNGGKLRIRSGYRQ